MQTIQRLTALFALCAGGAFAPGQLVPQQPPLYVDAESDARCLAGLSWATAYQTLDDALYWAGPAVGRVFCVRGNCIGCDSEPDDPSIVETFLVPDQVFFVPAFADADAIETPTLDPRLFHGDDPFPPCDPALPHYRFPSSLVADGDHFYLDRPAPLLADCADTNRDSNVDFFDIDPFLACLFDTCP
jgi:hypothetical protein